MECKVYSLYQSLGVKKGLSSWLSHTPFVNLYQPPEDKKNHQMMILLYWILIFINPGI